jgi:hypothetical protein
MLCSNSVFFNKLNLQLPPETGDIARSTVGVDRRQIRYAALVSGKYKDRSFALFSIIGHHWQLAGRFQCRSDRVGSMVRQSQ